MKDRKHSTTKVLVIHALVLALALVALPAPYALAAGPETWTTTGSMAEMRDGPAAVRLADGRVLVTGGWGGSPVATAELFDPGTGTWSSATSMSAARAWHTATLLADGRVLVAGGMDGGGAVIAVEAYDPSTNLWSNVASLLTGRSLHTTTLLPDGTVLLAGGQNSATNPIDGAEIIDAGAGSSTPAGIMSASRVRATATLLGTGKVLVAGGFDSSGELSSADLYDLGAGTWSSTASMAGGRYAQSATLLADGKVLLAGGFGFSGPLTSAQVFDPATELWTTASSMTEARSSHTASLLPDGSMLVAGGDGFTGYLSSAELYDPGTDAWSLTGAMAFARSEHASVSLADGRVLVAGGWSGTYLDSAELYEPAGWTAGTELAFSPSDALVCDEVTVSIDANDVTDLYGYQFEVTYDDTVVSASGAFVDSFFDTTVDASIPPGWDGTCAAGVCQFAVSKIDPGVPVSGSGAIAEITFTRIDAGEFDAAFSDSILSDRDANAIAHTTGTVHLSACGYADVSGVVSLQGRPTPIDAGEVTLTDVDGNFGPYAAAFDPTTGAYSIPSVAVLPAGSTYQFDAAHDLYLGNQMSQVLLPGDVYAAPNTILKGGDADNSDLIDISDLTCIGGSFGGAPSVCGADGSSDITADGSVNILDLVLPGGNYGLATPQAW